MYNLEPKPNCL